MRVTYEFYLDVFWVTNLVMDGAVLALTGLLGRQRISFLRLFFASAFGATASACLFLWLSSMKGYQLLLHFFVNPVMILIGFSWNGIWAFLRRFLEAYVVSIVLGGILSWLWPGQGAGFWLWAAAGCILIAAGILGQRLKKRGDHMFDVLLVGSGQKISARGFLDTGNHLWDPMLKRPVHIIQQELIPRELCEGPGMHYISYQSLGNEKGMLPVVVLEGMYIKAPAGEVQYIAKPICGLAGQSLFAGKPYQVILHGTVIK